MDETRTAQFDRPLNEVRLGESPSRPWGISIPAKYTNEESSSSVGSAPTASPQLPLETGRPIGETSQKRGKCPFDHRAVDQMPAHQNSPPFPPPLPPPASTAFRMPPPEQQAQPQAQAPQVKELESRRLIPQMVFNGPVFLGYPPDQLVALLQNSNLGAAMR